MKNKLFILIILSITLTTATFAQDAISDFLNQKAGGKAFAKLDEFLAENELEFERDSTIVMFFNEERVRLGANFETELWKYLGKDFRNVTVTMTMTVTMTVTLTMTMTVTSLRGVSPHSLFLLPN